MQLPSLIEIPNGDKVVPTFSDAEMKGRLERLRAYMAAENVEAVVFTSYHNINYFSDFVYCKFGREYGLVVTQDTFTTVTANIDGGQPYRRNRLGDNIVYTDWQKDNFFKAVKQLCAGKKRIGVEFDHLTLQYQQKLLSALGDVELVDIGEPTMKMRMVKSAEEIALIRQGARVADVGGVAVRDAISAGVPEYEVALAGQRAMVREIAKTYPNSELMDTWVWFQSGINTDGAHNPVTSRRVQPGDILSMNTFPMISGYYTALERTMFLEHASDEHLRIW
ncbi:MAG TPA: aminopeptidase P family N-terminal domain-containing protein, partial [Halomonas sp.]|nr:aminopeptidase P family N-terminal domain-containing protein [Halomonas sp.]